MNERIDEKHINENFIIVNILTNATLSGNSSTCLRMSWENDMFSGMSTSGNLLFMTDIFCKLVAELLKCVLCIEMVGML